MKLIQTKDKNYILLINTDAKIQLNDFITDGYKVWQWKDDSSLLGRYRVIASYPEIPELPLLPSPYKEEVDVEKLAKEKFPLPYKIHNRGIQKYTHKGRNPWKGLKKWNKAFIEGYKANNNKFSLDDIKKAIREGSMMRKLIISSTTSVKEAIDHYNKEEEKIIQSLSTSTLPVEFIPSIFQDRIMINETNNQIIGQYKY